VIYALLPEAATGPEITVDTGFGESIQLSGYMLVEMIVKPGDVLPVTLFWEALEPVGARYKVFLHLVGPDGLLAQRDAEPGNGARPTSGWQPGETIVDAYGLLVPGTAPAGEYNLVLGMYPLDDPAARLPIQTEAGVVDALELGVVVVDP
jgi:hypothetical protein